jgi:hypothetical protein
MACWPPPIFAGSSADEDAAMQDMSFTNRCSGQQRQSDPEAHIDMAGTGHPLTSFGDR